MAKSYSQLMQERERLDAAIEAARKREVEGVIKRMREAIAVYGLTATDVFGEPPKAQAAVKHVEAKTRVSVGKKSKGTASGKRPPKVKAKANPLLGRKRPAKYADGQGNTWSGGGLMANWLRDALEKGHKLEEFLVQKAA